MRMVLRAAIEDMQMYERRLRSSSKGGSADEKRAAANGADVAGEAAARLTQVAQTLDEASGGSSGPGGATGVRLVSLYALWRTRDGRRSDGTGPGYAVFDVELDGELSLVTKREHHWLGSLPLELETVEGQTRVRERGDTWLTTPKTTPPDAEDCARELNERRWQKLDLRSLTG